mgnify:CR=1 FL=1
MKKILILALLLYSSAVWAACTTHTIIGPNGRMVTCMTCCTSPGYCTTTCH